MKKIKILTLILLVITSVGCKKENEKENVAGDENKVENKINGHEYVDLGLPSGLKWATCNVGAAAPSDYGKYYAWGETETKSEYTTENSLTLDKEMNDISGNAQYDAARKIWGANWRIPTQPEWDELITYCARKWTTLNDVAGYLITGSNGNSIFLPAASCCMGTNQPVVFTSGFYWTSTPQEGGNVGALNVNFDSSSFTTSTPYGRHNGHSIRPVAY